jgi:hypothetical protein
MNIYNKCNNSSVVIIGKTSGSFRIFRGVRQGSVLPLMLFNMVMDEIARKVTEGHTRVDYHKLWYMKMTEIWEPNASASENKFQRVVTLCKDL